VRRSVQLAVSLACLALIGMGARYAYAREMLRNSDPHDVFVQVNRASFDGMLPDVPVTWVLHLDDAYAKTRTYENGTADIVVSRELVTSESRLRETLQHESCHLLTYDEAASLGEDDHGRLWQACMKRFE
jgi:hypothetical protein